MSVSRFLTTVLGEARDGAGNEDRGVMEEEDADGEHGTRAVVVAAGGSGGEAALGEDTADTRDEDERGLGDTVSV